MAPKKAKKTKQQLEEERKQAEEAARLAHEEALRLEAQEQARRAAEQEKRQKLTLVQTEREDARLASERDQLANIFSALHVKCRQEMKQQQEAESWEHSLQCSPLPDVTDAAGLHAYFAEAASRTHNDIASVLHTCQEYCTLMQHCKQLQLASLQKGDAELQQHCQKCVHQWQMVMTDVIDDHTAHMLQNMVEYEEDTAGIYVSSQTSSLKYGLWINTTKNPRLKTVEFPKLGISIEIPKLIALASVAVRVQWHEADQHLDECTANMIAVGGVLHLDIFSLPSPASKINSWTLRAVTPDTQVIHRRALSLCMATCPLAPQRLAYPMPPAGADPDTWVPEEEPQPIGISLTLPQGSVLPGTSPQAAVWDPKRQAWSTEGMSGVSSSGDGSAVSFHSKAVGSFAVVSERTGLLPYQEWHVRPTGGQFGAEAMVAVQTSNPEVVLGFQVTKQGVQLVEPHLHRLAALRGYTYSSASALLFKLMQLGLYLVPQLRDAQSADLHMKVSAVQCVIPDLACQAPLNKLHHCAQEPAVAKAMCEDVALLASTHLIMSSRWNRHMGPQVCLCRISKVTDWSEGGRTGVEHVKRIFSKEQPCGPHQVAALMRRGMKGVAFTDALDKRAVCPSLPEYGTPEYDSGPLDRLHATIPALLSSAAIQELPQTAEAVSAAQLGSDTGAFAETQAGDVPPVTPVLDPALLFDVEPNFAHNLAELVDGLGLLNS